MGSPSLALGLAPHLRPWHGAGLTHLLVGSAAISAMNPASQAPITNSPSVQPRTSSSQEHVAPISKEPSGSQPAPSLPAPWDFFWSKVTVGAKVVFTYPELSLDLTGKGDKKRGQLFREILLHLDWAGKGIVSFWPMNDGVVNNPDQSANIFWKGMDQIGAKHVVCFSGSGYSDLTGQALQSSGSHTFRDYTIHILPSPDQMFAMLPHERHMAADVLSSIRLP